MRRFVLFRGLCLQCFSPKISIIDKFLLIFQMHKRMLSLSQQHVMFLDFLKKEKDEVSKNLKKKIFPTSVYNDYEFLQIVGKGSYGKVVAAKNVQNQKIFAIKIIDKKYLVKEERLRHLMSEIRVLNSVKFEFLLSLESYFTNECFVFIVMPLIRGAHFLEILRAVGKFNENTARFFAGQVVLALEYLHYMGIVFRDLKPENLLLDVQGYLKLVDFGFSKYIGHSFSYSFCGTPEYLAPEILLSKGHNVSPDWWTLGILLYEMCNGTPPFKSRNEIKLYEKILEGNIVWPPDFSKELKSLVQGLLEVDKTRRLGCQKGKAADVKFHKWFSPLDWFALWKKKLSSPVTPEEVEISSVTNNELVFTNKNCFIPGSMIGNIDFAI